MDDNSCHPSSNRCRYSSEYLHLFELGWQEYTILNGLYNKQNYTNHIFISYNTTKQYFTKQLRGERGLVSLRAVPPQSGRENLSAHAIQAWHGKAVFFGLYRILRGLGVVQASATECWPQKVEKMPENLFFFVVTKIRITIFFFFFFSHIF